MKFSEKMVGAIGFEPTTPGPPDQCANRAAPRSDKLMDYIVSCPFF